MAMPNSKFLNKIVVDRTIKQLVEEKTLWEKYLTKQSVDGLNVLYYEEQYMDIETPNDSAFSSKTLDPYGEKPAYRGEGALFPHADIGEPVEYNLRLYQLALEMDYTDEEMKYSELENRILKKHEKLGNYMASNFNSILGNAVTEDWSASPSNINQVDIASGAEWSGGPSDTDVDPIGDILSAMENIDDVPGYNYDPDNLFMSKQTYYDLLHWVTQKNYEYSLGGIDSAQAQNSFLGLNVVVSNMVKRDFAVVADLPRCGVLYEAEPLSTKKYYTEEDRTHHIQATRTMNFALTDPKAVCTIYNTVA